jgi:hypothetical protein
MGEWGMKKDRFDTYKCAPLDSSKWKCNWIECAGGMGLAGNGCCSFYGTWDKKNCKYFMTESDFIKKYEKEN